jgi:DNA polymerase I-like protein with 3'-5' exonuclease and polymerase domains
MLPYSDELSILQACLEHSCCSFLLPRPFLPLLAPAELSRLAAIEKRYKAARRKINPRCAVVPRDGFCFVSADWAQAELRIVAHFSQDPELAAVFAQQAQAQAQADAEARGAAAAHASGAGAGAGAGAIKPRPKQPPDVFRAVAARWRGHCDESRVDDQERGAVKKILYCILYGSGPGKVAAEAGISRELAKVLLNDFLKHYKSLPHFIKAVQVGARASGYVSTLLGRLRLVVPPALREAKRDKQPGQGPGGPGSGSGQEQGQGQGQGGSRDGADKAKRSNALARADRQAFNSVCQGSCADLLKLSMINIHARLRQNHDRLVPTDADPETGAAPGFAIFRYPTGHLAAYPRASGAAGHADASFDAYLVLSIHDELLFEVRRPFASFLAGLVKEVMETSLAAECPTLLLAVKCKKGESWGNMRDV